MLMGSNQGSSVGSQVERKKLSFFRISIPILSIIGIVGIAGGIASAIEDPSESPPPARTTSPQMSPRLAIVIVIDQFRADYLMRFESEFLPARGPDGELGGFRYLMQEGAYYPYGQYSLMQSMTCPGHATILSGSFPYQSGIPLNTWYDSKLKREVYCVEDSESALVGAGRFTDSQSGRSPKNFIGTTVGDEMKNAGYSSRVISISLKDRASILLGGHRADLALWFDSTNWRWISSRYYIPEGDLPSWVQALNQKIDSKGGKNDLATPLGLELTEQAAEASVRGLSLGKKLPQEPEDGPLHPHSTDLLAISFSSHDMAGHSYGPNSQEMKDMTLAEDRILSRFLNFLKNESDTRTLDDTVIVLTGDHGIPPHPDWLKTRKIPTGRMPEKTIAVSLSQELNKRLGPPLEGDWVTDVKSLNIYLNSELDSAKLMKAKGLSRSKVEYEAKTILSQYPEIAHVFTSTDYVNRTLPPGIFEKQILNTYYPGRNGDIVLIPKPFFFAEKPQEHRVSHMTGYSYDRTVPIIFSGSKIHGGVFLNNANVVDIAPTLSWILGTLPPSLSEGRVLHEIF